MSKKYIGGGDLPAILGIDNYRTNVDIWLAKAMGEKVEPNAFMTAGLILEPYVCDRFARETGFKLIDLEGEEKFKIHKDYDFLMGVADRIILSSEGNSILEVKTTRMNLTEPADSWIIQANWYMEIHNLETAVIAWLTLPDTLDYELFCERYNENSDLSFLDTVTKLRYEPIERNQELIDKCKAEAVSFWKNHVETKVPPEPKTALDVLKLYPIHTTNKTIQVNEKIYQSCIRYNDLKDMVKVYEYEKEVIKEQLQLLMKDAEAIIYDGKKIFTWKAQSKKSIDEQKVKELLGDKIDDCYKISNFRVFR